MAMTQLSLMGQSNGTGDANALFKTVFGGLVLRAYEAKRKMLPLITSRNVTNGKAVDFSLIGPASAFYHTAGENILTDNDAGDTNYLSSIRHAKATISLNDKLLAATTIDELDNLKNDFDSRSQLAAELGRVLADREDRLIIQAIRASTVASDRYTGEPAAGGSVQVDWYASTDTANTFSVISDSMVEQIFEAASILDQGNVPAEGRYFVMHPSYKQYLTRNTTVLNSDWGGAGSYAEGTAPRVAGFTILDSTNVPITNIAAEAGEQNSLHADFTRTIGVAFHSDAAACAKLGGAGGISMSTDWMPEYQAHLLVASQVAGYGALKREAAVLVQKEVNP